MRPVLLLPLVLLAACSRPPEPPTTHLAPITVEPIPFVTDPPWLTPRDQRASITGDVKTQWSIQAVVVSDQPDRLTARGLPIPGEEPRVVTDQKRIEGREIFGGVCLGAGNEHPSVIEGTQVRQRSFIADYQVKSQKPLPVQRILNEGDFFQLRLTQQGTEPQLSAINIRINRLLATTRATIHCRSGYELPIEEPLIAAGDGAPLTSPIPLGTAPLMVAVPLRWTLIRPTAQVRAWGTTIGEVTVPTPITATDEALVAIVLIRPVAQAAP